MISLPGLLCLPVLLFFLAGCPCINAIPRGGYAKLILDGRQAACTHRKPQDEECPSTVTGPRPNCIPYRSPESCPEAYSFPTHISKRKSFLRDRKDQLEKDGWWFHHLENKVAAYVFSAAVGIASPQMYYCGRLNEQAMDTLDDGSSRSAFVIRSTGFHSSEGIYIFPHGINGGVELIRGVSMTFKDILSDLNMLARTNQDSVIIEEYIPGPSGGLPTEYKFHVFNGVIGSINVVHNRGTPCGCWAEINDDGERLDQFGCFIPELQPVNRNDNSAEECFDIDFNEGALRPYPMKGFEICSEIPHIDPCVWERMLEIARNASLLIGVYIRIDMFVGANGQVYVQEYTTNHMNGLRHCSAKKLPNGCIDSCFQGAMWESMGGNSTLGGFQTPNPLLDFLALEGDDAMCALATSYMQQPPDTRCVTSGPTVASVPPTPAPVLKAKTLLQQMIDPEPPTSFRISPTAAPLQPTGMPMHSLPPTAVFPIPPTLSPVLSKSAPLQPTLSQEPPAPSPVLPTAAPLQLTVASSLLAMEAPVVPTLAPVLPIVIPILSMSSPLLQPTLSSEPPTPFLVLPTVTPVQPTQAPSLLPTGAPVLPTPAPVLPTVSPISPTLSPVLLTAAPLQPTPAPFPPTPSPVPPTATPVQPSVMPSLPLTYAPLIPTPAPVLPTAIPMPPTSSPVFPTEAPLQPTLRPEPPTPFPVSPTVTPVQPTQAPSLLPTKAPVVPTPAPVLPTVSPIPPTVSPVLLTAAPLQPTPAPFPPTPSPVPPTVMPSLPLTNAPLIPTPAPVLPIVFPIPPTSSPVFPTEAPLLPTLSPEPPTPFPVSPTVTPVQPTQAPSLLPTGAPVLPTPAPVLPTVSLIPPTVSPVLLTAAPLQPTPALFPPTPSPVPPTATPVQPSVMPSLSLTNAPLIPTPAPVLPIVFSIPPTSSPVFPTEAPLQPTLRPEPPTPFPVSPTVTPVQPTQAPSLLPTKAPVVPTPAPVLPTVSPIPPTISPVLLTAAPLQPTPAPFPPTPSPVPPTATPVQPSVTPSLSPTDSQLVPAAIPVQSTPSPVPQAAVFVQPSIAPLQVPLSRASEPSLLPLPVLSVSLPPLKIDESFRNGTLPTFQWEVSAAGGNGGLAITFQNALSDLWQNEFSRAFSEWDSGAPDALTLTTERVAVDPECQVVAGVVKICDGDYGETTWRGKAAIVVSPRGFIIASTVRINNYYLDEANRNPGRRQYIVCHEMGHSFGLPHSDENFENEDLFTCMDLTRTPINNQSPSADDFKTLARWYLQADGTTSNYSKSNKNKININKSNKNDNDKSNINNNRRSLEGILTERATPQPPIPSDLALRIRAAEDQVLLRRGEEGRPLLLTTIVRNHSGADFDVALVDVGDGIRVMISQMLG